MVLATDLGGQHSDLTARIDAARRRLAEENSMEWAEIGTLLEGISLELEQANHRDDAERASTYARLDGALSQIDAKLPPAASQS